MELSENERMEKRRRVREVGEKGVEDIEMEEGEGE